MRASNTCVNFFLALAKLADGAFSHNINYVTIFLEILNPKGHSNCITGSKVKVILLNGWILPIAEASSGRVCACSLRSRLVFKQTLLVYKSWLCSRRGGKDVVHYRVYVFESFITFIYKGPW